MKDQLVSKGWSCVPCSCPGAKGFDCANKKFRGVIIQTRIGNRFKIVKNGMLIDNGFGYQLELKLKENELV